MSDENEKAEEAQEAREAFRAVKKRMKSLSKSEIIDLLYQTHLYAEHFKQRSIILEAELQALKEERK